MPAVLTHKSVMLLARERLADLARALANKERRQGNLTPVERRIRHMAEKALEVSNRPAPANNAFETPAGPYLPPLGAGVSPYAVMGAMGPDLTGFSAILRRGQAWVFDSVHKGSPDANRELVHAATVDFAIALWQQFAQRTTDATKLDQGRAFVFGYLSHVATDALLHPWVAGVEWKSATTDFPKFSHSRVESRLEAQVAQQVLLRGSTRSGQNWSQWWPADDAPPAELFEAFAAAFEEVHGRNSRPLGLPQFEATLRDEGGAAPLNAEFVKDGWRVARSGMVGMVYDTTYWEWFGPLSLFVIPMVLLPVLAAALPNSRKLFQPENKPGDHGERAWFALVACSLLLTAHLPLATVGWVSSMTRAGSEDYSTALLVTSAFVTVLTLGAFIVAAAEPTDAGERGTPWWLRWIVLAGPQLALLTINTGFGVGDIIAGNKRRGGVTLLAYALPLVMVGLFLLYFLALHHWTVKEGNNGWFDDGHYWGWFAVWFALWVGLGYFLCAYGLRDIAIHEYPDANVTNKRHRVRLFDDASLYSLPHPERPAESVLHFPSGRRKLLHVWWTGDGDLWIRPHRAGLDFSFSGDADQAPTQTVVGPVAGMKLSEYARWLELQVKDGGGATGKLRAKLAPPEGPDVVLPPGAAFSDHGDGETKLADHDREARKYKKLGKEEAADSGYVLLHAPKSAQSIAFGERGAAPIDPGAQAEDPDGYRVVHDPSEGITSDTLMGYAADLTALLWMGAVPHVHTDGALDVAGLGADARLGKVHQVFRNWNLDRRRVLEWRTLVAGQAQSDKSGAPESWQPGMLKLAQGQAYASANPGGEVWARKLGWVPLMRQWVKMARQTGVDPTTGDAAWEGGPERRDLSRAMAWLLDLPAV